MKNPIWLTLGLALVCLHCPVNSAEFPDPLAGVRVLRDIPYVSNPHQRQKLDLYLAPGDQPHPLIIWIHGGAWKAGDKGRTPALRFLQRGYSVASTNYRLSQHAVWPAQIEDCKAAIRWLRAHAEQYQLDPDRFGAWGASAGGHLVAMLGVTGDIRHFDRGDHLDHSSAVQAVVDFFGPTDFLQMDAHRPPDGLVHNGPDSPESLLVGGPIQEHPDRVARANPITYASKNDSPILIVHGDSDKLVPHHQSVILNEALQSVGAKVSFHTVKQGGHGRFSDPRIDALVDTHFAQFLMFSRRSDRVDSFVYKTTAQGDLRIHVHYPEGWKPSDQRPGMIFFFGGGWTGGTTDHFMPQAEDFASRGLVTARADYRVRSRQGVTPDKCVEDAMSAVRWFRANAEKLGIAPDRIIGSGGSAGGHIVACAAFIESGRDAERFIGVSSRANYLVFFNPVLDTVALGPDRFVDAQGNDVAESLSPLMHVSQPIPPTLLLFGTDDRFLEGAERFVDKAREHGGHVELWTAAEQRHAFFNSSPWLESTVDRSDRFLESMGLLSGAPELIVPAEANLASR